MSDIKKKLLISFSGGRTSAFMTKWLLENKSNEYEFIIVFANTGHEREATLKFINECDKKWNFGTIWIEYALINNKSTYKIVNYETAYRNYKKNGIDPFTESIKKYGMPNMVHPNCSRDLKKHTIRKFMREMGYKNKDYQTALGIRSDEPKRLNWDRAKKERIIYFAEFGKVTKDTINKFWAAQDFDLEIKSFEGNCIMCWKKSSRKLFTIIQEGLKSSDFELFAEIEWLRDIHQKYGYESKNKDNKITMFRKNRNIDDMICESEFLDITEFAQDESKLISTAIQLSLWEEELDGNFGCVESCEAF